MQNKPVSTVFIFCSNKEIDALIFNTKSASEIAKVINYRKKNLDLQGDALLHVATYIHISMCVYMHLSMH